MIGMYQVSSQAEQVWQDISRTGEEFVKSVPTFDRTIDSYFENNLEMIMEEWGLVTGTDLDLISRKIDYLSYEVGRLVAERSTIEQRIKGLSDAINDLEAKK